MKIKALLYCIIIILFIFACSEHTVQPPAELANGRVIGTIHGLVYDFCSQTLFDSGAVTVTWVVDGTMKSTISHNKGYYIITELPPGDYTIHFTGSAGFAVGKIVVHVPTLEEILYSAGELGGPPPTDRDYEHTISEDIYLYQKNAGLKGHVYKKESDQTTSLAQGVRVVANYTYRVEHSESFVEGYSIYPAKYTTTTDAAGFFSFDSLPGTPDVIIETLPYSYSTNDYEFTYISEYLVQNSIRLMDDIILEITSPEPFIVQNNFINKNNLPLTSSLMITFSKAMDVQSFTYNLAYDNTVECDTTWSNNILLTINPCVDLLPDEDYSLFLLGKSTDNHDFEANLAFTTQKGIEFVSTNLERIQDVYDEFPVDENIELTFSMPVTSACLDTSVILWDEDYHEVITNLSLSSDHKTIIVAHTDTLEPNQDYYLVYSVASTIPGDHINNTIYFRTASNTQVPSQVSSFSLSNTSWDANWNTTSISLRWNTLENADQYKVYAKDDHENSNRIHIGTFNDMDYMSWQSGSVTLPSSQFDYYSDDGYITPFLNGTAVTLYIAAVNDAGMGTFSSLPPITDDVDPNILLSGQTGSADNSGGSSDIIIIVYFSANEYLSEINFTHTFTAGSTLDGNDITDINWDSDHANKMGGSLEITIENGVDASGDELIFRCYDTSNNRGSDTLILF